VCESMAPMATRKHPQLTSVSASCTSVSSAVTHATTVTTTLNRTHTTNDTILYRLHTGSGTTEEHTLKTIPAVVMQNASAITERRCVNSEMTMALLVIASASIATSPACFFS